MPQSQIEGYQDPSRFRLPGKLLRIDIVNPEGDIETVNYGLGVGDKSTSKVIYENGEAYISRQYAKQGYITLEEAFRDDDRPHVKENGFRVYNEWRRAVNEDRAPKHTIERGQGEPRLAPAPYPDKYLPRAVLLRRAGMSDVSAKKFEFPDFPEPTMGFELEPEEAAKPEKGKSKGKGKGAG